MHTYLVTLMIAAEQRQLLVRADGHEIHGPDIVFFRAPDHQSGVPAKWIARFPRLETSDIRELSESEYHAQLGRIVLVQAESGGLTAPQLVEAVERLDAGGTPDVLHASREVIEQILRSHPHIAARIHLTLQSAA